MTTVQEINHAVVSDMLMRTLRLTPTITKGVDTKKLVNEVIANKTFNFAKNSSISLLADTIKGDVKAGVTPKAAMRNSVTYERHVNEYANSFALGIANILNILRTDVFNTATKLDECIRNTLKNSHEDDATIVGDKSEFELLEWDNCLNATPSDTSEMFDVAKTVANVDLDRPNDYIVEAVLTHLNDKLRELPNLSKILNTDDTPEELDKIYTLLGTSFYNDIATAAARLNNYKSKQLYQLISFIARGACGYLSKLHEARRMDFSNVANSDLITDYIDKAGVILALLRGAIYIFRNKIQDILILPMSENGDRYIINADACELYLKKCESAEPPIDHKQQLNNFMIWIHSDAATSYSAAISGVNINTVVHMDTDRLTTAVERLKQEITTTNNINKSNRVRSITERVCRTWATENLDQVNTNIPMLDKMIVKAGNAVTVKNALPLDACIEFIVDTKFNNALSEFYTTSKSATTKMLHSGTTVLDNVGNTAICSAAINTIVGFLVKH